jgi:AcrR family transcriptional regulator
MASTLEDRAAARRAALIEAGVELIGTEGAAAVTVRAVCRGARLTERYFYEAFPEGGRDALLRAVHDKVAAQAREAIVAAVARHQGDEASLALATVSAGFRGRSHEESLAYSAVAAFTAFLEEDPRRGRVLVSESFHESVLARHDIELVPAFAALLVAQIRALPDAPDDTDAELTAVALLGALRAIYLVWLSGTPAVSTQRLNAHAARLVVAAARVSSRDIHD